MSKPTDDQDLHDWRRDNRKSHKQIIDKITRQRRKEADEVLRRYDDERVDDAEPMPRID